MPDQRSSARLLMISGGRAERPYQLPLGPAFTGTVQLGLWEGEAASADQAHVELQTEEGPPAGPAAAFTITQHLKPRMKLLVAVQQHKDVFFVVVFLVPARWRPLTSHHDVVLQQLRRLELETKRVRAGGANVAATDTNRRDCGVWNGAGGTRRPVLLDGRRAGGL